ncbi:MULTISPECIES: DUF3717 domain-containing protein [Paraburkholderia]|uniref:DUF3717 domain-containing protein n=1 Tax=Paraburkholderia TaxID=1822464 RepID=UPI0032DEC626
MEYTLTDLENAINYWRAQHPGDDGASLCAEARALAEPYTLMFMEHRTTIAASDLSHEQQEAIEAVLKPHG